MEISYFQYHFSNPFLVFLFCVFTAILISFICSLDEYNEALFIAGGVSLATNAFCLLFSFLIYNREESRKVIHPVNQMVSDYMLIIAAIICGGIILMHLLRVLRKARTEKRRKKVLIQNLQAKYLNTQNHLFTLGESYVGITKNKIIQIRRKLEDLKQKITYLEFAEDIDKEVSRLNVELSGIEGSIQELLDYETATHNYLNTTNSKKLVGELSEREAGHYEYLNKFAAIDFVKAHHYIKTYNLN